MADARIAYIQERLELGLEGWDPSPSVASFLENAKNKQVWPTPPSWWNVEKRSGASRCSSSSRKEIDAAQLRHRPPPGSRAAMSAGPLAHALDHVGGS
jgi:hypothetical protein